MVSDPSEWSQDCVRSDYRIRSYGAVVIYAATIFDYCVIANYDTRMDAHEMSYADIIPYLSCLVKVNVTRTRIFTDSLGNGFLVHGQERPSCLGLYDERSPAGFVYN